MTGLAFLPALSRYGLLDLTPVAWAAVVRGMEDAVFVIDGLGRIVELNPAGERLLGRKASEVLGAEAARVFDPMAGAGRSPRAVGERGEGSFELIGPDPDDSTVLDARISRLGDSPPGGLRDDGDGDGEGERDGGRPDAFGWVLVLRDISALEAGRGRAGTGAPRAGGRAPRPRRPTGPRITSWRPSATSCVRR